MRSLPVELPPRLSLEISFRCNFECPVCSCIWEEDRTAVGGEISTTDWKDILTALANRGVQRLEFTGGEPLLRSDVWDLLRFARQVLPSAELALFTNASLLNEADLRLSRSLRVQVATSLQGWTTYSAMTGTERSVRDLLRALIRAAEFDWPMTVTLTATAVNAFEVPNMLAGAIAAGAAAVTVNPVMAEGRARRHPELFLERSAWEDLKIQCCRVERNGVPLYLGDEMSCSCRRKGRIRGCPAGRDFGVLGPDGVYRPCLHFFTSQVG